MINKTIAVLGSSGSVGTQALDVAKRQNIRVAGISGGSRIDILEDQIREFHPDYCAVVDSDKARHLRSAIADTSTKIIDGKDAATRLAEICNADTVVNAISGFAGLEPTLAVIKAKKRLALANKESLVTAGEIVMRLARECGSEILPVDSEHCAIHQCISGKKAKKILLTASGGPFFGKKREELKDITPEIALRHPTWKMGNKITIDSATLMNKGFEVIEAAHLYNMSADKVQVVVHRESIIHSMVEFEDGAVLAQLSNPDMRLCVSYAVNYPDRIDAGIEPLDFTKIKELHFDVPDMETFRLLGLAYKAYGMGGIYGSVMNAANEVAVEAFLLGKISFNDITVMVCEITLDAEKINNPTVEDIICADKETREKAKALLRA